MNLTQSPIVSSSSSSLFTSSSSHLNYNPFQFLNDDCLELVFAYLRLRDKLKVERVSPRWKALLYRYQNELKMSEIKYQLKASPRRCRIDCYTLRSVLRKCQFIEKIDLSGEIRIENWMNVLNVIGKNCIHLSQLTIQLGNIDLKSLIAFGNKFGFKLKKLRITIDVKFKLMLMLDKQWKTEKRQTLQALLVQFLEKCYNLEDLSCPFLCIKDEDDSYLPKLKKISCNINQDDIETLRRNYRFIPCLVNLQMRDGIISNQFRDEKIEHSREKFYEIISQMSGLEKLELACSSYSQGIIEIISDKVSKHCWKTLKAINVTYFPSKTPNQFFTTVCPNLTRLSIRMSINHHLIKNIIKSFSNLVYIELFPTTNGFTNEILLEISQLSKLQHVRLSNSGIVIVSTDEGIVHLITSCSQLKSLELSKFMRLKCETVETIVQVVKSRTLELNILQVNSINSVSDANLKVKSFQNRYHNLNLFHHKYLNKS